jgi:DNA-binding NtrC family response regulator
MHLDQQTTSTGRNRRTEKPATQVLLVEDEVLIALDLQNALESCNCDVVGPTSSIRAATELINAHHVDVALVDLYLSDGNAEPLLALLEKKGIPFALCTGAEPRAMQKRFPRMLIMRKPYIFDHACEVVDKLIEQR